MTEAGSGRRRKAVTTDRPDPLVEKFGKRVDGGNKKTTDAPSEARRTDTLAVSRQPNGQTIKGKEGGKCPCRICNKYFESMPDKFNLCWTHTRMMDQVVAGWLRAPHQTKETYEYSNDFKKTNVVLALRKKCCLAMRTMRG